MVSEGFFIGFEFVYPIVQRSSVEYPVMPTPSIKSLWYHINWTLIHTDSQSSRRQRKRLAQVCCFVLRLGEALESSERFWKAPEDLRTKPHKSSAALEEQYKPQPKTRDQSGPHKPQAAFKPIKDTQTNLQLEPNPPRPNHQRDQYSSRGS